MEESCTRFARTRESRPGPLPSARSVLRFRILFHAAAGLTGIFLALSGRVETFPVVLLAGLSALTSPLGAFAAVRAVPMRAVLVVLLVYDVFVLTLGLSWTGGAANPFTLLYFVQVTLAAVTLPRLGTAAVVACASLGYAGLFFSERPVLGLHDGYASHLQGMWIAFTVTATLVGGFVSRLTEAFVREREIRADTSHLLRLTTLAAGAAHELGNPLGTIKIVAADLERELRAGDGTHDWAEDAHVIVEEVDRARAVLDRMALGAGELTGEGPRWVDVDAVIDALRGHLGGCAGRLEIVRRTSASTAELQIPVLSAAQAIAQVVRNAFDADPGGRVTLEVKTDVQWAWFTVKDQGEGMSTPILKRAGEPFFTTKAPGSGMGLGLFLTRTLVEQLGGELRIESVLGQGTKVSVKLPRAIKSGAGFSAPSAEVKSSPLT